MRDIYEFLFVKGGPVMYPILLGSVVGLALFLERIWALRREKVVPSLLRQRVRVLIREGRLPEAEVLCQENGSALANVVGAALRDAGRPRPEVKEVASEAGRREVAQMERYVENLGTVAAVEPLLGLLGTVTGLIRAFQRVEALASKGGGVSPGALAAGIWEALITTATGLTIAIPAYVGYRYLQSRVDSLTVDLEEDSLALAEMVAAPGAEEEGRSPARDDEEPEA